MWDETIQIAAGGLYFRVFLILYLGSGQLRRSHFCLKELLEIHC